MRNTETSQMTATIPVPVNTAPASGAPQTASVELRPAPGKQIGWRNVPKQLGYLMPILFLALPVGIITVTLGAVGVGTLILSVGVFLLLGALYLARGFGTLEIKRLAMAGLPVIPSPRWEQSADLSWWAKVRHVALSKNYWRYWLYSFVQMILGPILWGAAFAWTCFTLALPLGLIQWWINPESSLGTLLYSLTGRPGAGTPTGTAFLIDMGIYGGLTILAVLTLPAVLGGLTLLQYHIAASMLGRSRTDELTERVGELSSSRAAAVSAEDRALRRLERDIHDGPQQQLLRLQMDLAEVERQLGDTEEARRISAASSRAGDTLAELRRLSKGLAPPLLQDRGLAAALDALAERNPVSTSMRLSLDEQMPVPPVIQQNAYFIVSELYANAIEHSGASSIETAVGTTVLRGRPTLYLRVSDNGRGDAQAKLGGGLEGLMERVHGLGGEFELSSPSGGPTRVLVRLPL